MAHMPESCCFPDRIMWSRIGSLIHCLQLPGKIPDCRWTQVRAWWCTFVDKNSVLFFGSYFWENSQNRVRAAGLLLPMKNRIQLVNSRPRIHQILSESHIKHSKKIVHSDLWQTDGTRISPNSTMRLIYWILITICHAPTEKASNCMHRNCAFRPEDRVTPRWNRMNFGP